MPEVIEDPTLDQEDELSRVPVRPPTPAPAPSSPDPSRDYFDSLAAGRLSAPAVTGPAVARPAGAYPQPDPSTLAPYTLRNQFPQPSPNTMPGNPFGNIPIAQAEKAVQSAMKFQGMRTYQQALQAGKPAAEAMMIAGPMLFGGRIPTSVMRATQPPKPDIRHIGQRAYRVNPDGSLTPLTPEPAVKPPVVRPDPFDSIEFKSIQDSMRSIEHAVAKGDMSMEEGRKAIARHQAEAEDIRRRHAARLAAEQPGPPGGTPTARVSSPEGTAPPPSSPASPAPATAPKFREGQRVRDRSTGKIYVIRDGKPVEE